MRFPVLSSAFALSAIALMASLSAAHGQASREKKPSVVERVQKVPLLLYLAKGDRDACGKNCSEWIAVEGHFDSGAAARFRAFTKRLGNRKLPVVFHSPGGDLKNALAIGRMLRSRGVTTSAGMTIPEGCAAAEDDACKAIKRSGKPVQAQLLAAGGRCNSACVWALFGGVVRDVPPGAVLGVHAAKHIITVKRHPGVTVSRERVAAFARTQRQLSDAQTRAYIVAMGISPDVLTLADSIPHEKLRALTREEVIRFGIDSREFQETRWALVSLQTRGPIAFKHFLENKGVGLKDFRTSYLRLYCAGAQNVRVDYIRSLTPHESALPAAVSLTFGDRELSLQQSNRSFTEDTQWRSAPFEFAEAAARAEQFTIVEEYKTAAGARQGVRVVKLRNDGLAGAIELLRPSCGKPAV
jgi:hypothetical protein